MSNPSSSPMMQSSLVNPLADSTGASPFSTMKRDVTVSSLLNSPHLVPTLCASESHALIRDALMCKDTSLAHLQYGLPSPSPWYNSCSSMPEVPTWHIYEDPLPTTSDTVAKSILDFLGPNPLNLDVDPTEVTIPEGPPRKKVKRRSSPEISYLLENRPSKSSRMKTVEMPGPLSSEDPKHGTPSWRSYRLIGRSWYPLPSSSFTVHPALERPD